MQLLYMLLNTNVISPCKAGLFMHNTKNSDFSTKNQKVIVSHLPSQRSLKRSGSCVFSHQVCST